MNWMHRRRCAQHGRGRRWSPRWSILCNKTNNLKRLSLKRRREVYRVNTLRMRFRIESRLRAIDAAGQFRWWRTGFERRRIHCNRHQQTEEDRRHCTVPLNTFVLGFTSLVWFLFDLDRRRTICMIFVWFYPTRDTSTALWLAISGHMDQPIILFHFGFMPYTQGTFPPLMVHTQVNLSTSDKTASTNHRTVTYRRLPFNDIEIRV